MSQRDENEAPDYLPLDEMFIEAARRRLGIAEGRWVGFSRFAADHVQEAAKQGPYRLGNALWKVCERWDDDRHSAKPHEQSWLHLVEVKA